MGILDRKTANLSVSNLSMTVSLLLSCVLFCTEKLNAYHFDYSKPITYQFPITPNDHKKLEQVTLLMDFLKNEYGNLIETTNLKTHFNWNFDWQMDYIGAGSTYYENQFSIMLFGGMIRAEGSSFQMIALTLCHEFGHYLGGTPKQRLENKINGDWSSSEGQSDWFAAQECLPKVYTYFKTHQPELLKIDYPTETQIHCIPSVSTANVSKDNLQQCQWIMSAGLNFAEFVHYYHDRDSEKVSLHKTALEKPIKTLHSSYPTSQCRLDTYKQGAICSTAKNSYLNKSYCQRPRCWFNPADTLHN